MFPTRNLAIIALLFLPLGCSRSTPPAAATPSATNTATTAEPPQSRSTEHVAGTVADSEIEKAVGELSLENQTLAKKQRVCPVSGEALGSMGKPFKITVRGQTVFLCCAGCEEEVQKNADKYLTKLDAAK